MNKRSSSVYSVCSDPPEWTPSVLYLREWYFYIYIEENELDALFPDSLSLSLSYKQMPFTLKVENDGKSPFYRHKSDRKQYLLSQSRHQGPNWPPHSARHYRVSVNPSQSSYLETCVILCIVLTGTAAKGCHSHCLCAYMVSQNRELILLKIKHFCHCFCWVDWWPAWSNVG